MLSKSGWMVIKKGIIEPDALGACWERRLTQEQQIETQLNSKVIQRFDMILTDALSMRASDIHIEVREGGTQFRFREDGELIPYKPEMNLSREDGHNLCVVIYNVLATSKAVAFDERAYQQGAVDRTVADTQVKLRYQSTPHHPYGYDVVLRVLPINKHERFTPLKDLGYGPGQIDDIESIIARPLGALIISGETGSGKSTTLKNIMMLLGERAQNRIKMTSIEDPPEYLIPGVTQIPVIIGKDQDPNVSPFEAPIKACMRLDPDVIMIGEIRDQMTGNLAQKAIQSGHQVLTTLHTTSAMGNIERLIDLSLSPRVMGSPNFLNGLIYQRLLPILCRGCRINLHQAIGAGAVLPEGVTQVALVAVYKRIQKLLDQVSRILHIKKFGPNSRETPRPLMIERLPLHIRGLGCPSCKGRGIRGRTVCAEVVRPDLEMMELIQNNQTLLLVKYWQSLSDQDPFSNNMQGKTAMEHGFLKVAGGMISPLDLEASFRPLDEMLPTYRSKRGSMVGEVWGDGATPTSAQGARSSAPDSHTPGGSVFDMPPMV